MTSSRGGSRRLTCERLEDRAYLTSTALSFVGMTAFNSQQPYPGVGLTVDGSHGPNNSRWSIAFVDTGIDLDHPYFIRNGSSGGVADRILYQHDFYDNDADASDSDAPYGHGSGVAAVAAGYKAAGSPGPFLGVAPGADIIALKVFPNDTSAMNDPAFDVAINQALTWVLNNKDQYNIAAVNMSLGNASTNLNSPTVGPYSAVLAQLQAAGVIVVASAGNENYKEAFGNRHLYNAANEVNHPGVQYPAADANVIGVSALFDTEVPSPSVASTFCTHDAFPGIKDCAVQPGQIVHFSQRGAETDTLAPGVAIHTAGMYGDVVVHDGTSFAAPIVSGMAVLAQEMQWKLTGTRMTTAQFRDILRNTGPLIFDGPTPQGLNDPSEIDKVANTNTYYRRVDMLAIADKVVSPKVAGVTIGSTGAQLDYDVPADGTGAQRKTLPLFNAAAVNEIKVKFTEGVTIQQSHLTIRPVGGAALAIQSFTAPSAQNSYTATWVTTAGLGAGYFELELSDSIVDAAGNHLDGEWTNPSSATQASGASSWPSGNGVSGTQSGGSPSSFKLRFVIQPGDIDRDNDVDLDDLNTVRNNFGGSTTGGLLSEWQYGNMDWVSGSDELVDLDDLNAVRNNFGAIWGGGGQLMLMSGGAGQIGEAALRAALYELYLSYLANSTKDDPFGDLFGWDQLGDDAWWKVTLSGEVE